MVTYSYDPAIAWASDDSNALTFTPPDSSIVGANSIEITQKSDTTAGSGNGVVVTAFTIILTVLEINSPPEITATDCSSSSITVGQDYSCSVLAFTDVDVGDSHEYRVEGDFDSDFMTFTGSAFTVSPILNS